MVLLKVICCAISVPDEISHLQFHNISDRSVTVVWQPPKHSNGLLIGYSVVYMVKDRTDTLKSENVTETATQTTIINLMVSTKSSNLYTLNPKNYLTIVSFFRRYVQPTTHYKFEVYAWTRVGAGPSKTATIQSGVEPVLPHSPAKLAITNIEAFSVVLQFTPGFDGNSSITKWIVEVNIVFLRISAYYDIPC